MAYRSSCRRTVVRHASQAIFPSAPGGSSLNVRNSFQCAKTYASFAAWLFLGRLIAEGKRRRRYCSPESSRIGKIDLCCLRPGPALGRPWAGRLKRNWCMYIHVQPGPPTTTKPTDCLCCCCFYCMNKGQRCCIETQNLRVHVLRGWPRSRGGRGGSGGLHKGTYYRTGWMNEK